MEISRIQLQNYKYLLLALSKKLAVVGRTSVENNCGLHVAQRKNIRAEKTINYTSSGRGNQGSNRVHVFTHLQVHFG